GRAAGPACGRGHASRRPQPPARGGPAGASGRGLPGPTTRAPSLAPRQVPLPMLPPTQPQMIQRPAGPTGPNVCQPGNPARAYQTVSLPRSRPAEPLPFPQGPLPQGPQTASVTQVTASPAPPPLHAPL